MGCFFFWSGVLFQDKNYIPVDAMHGDRLFIIIPKQAAWLGGMVDLVAKENEGLKLNAAQIAALEKEFMDTFETFTVILSLSKK